MFIVVTKLEQNESLVFTSLNASLFFMMRKIGKSNRIILLKLDVVSIMFVVVTNLERNESLFFTMSKIN